MHVVADAWTYSPRLIFLHRFIYCLVGVNDTKNCKGNLVVLRLINSLINTTCKIELYLIHMSPHLDGAK